MLEDDCSDILRALRKAAVELSGCRRVGRGAPWGPREHFRHGGSLLSDPQNIARLLPVLDSLERSFGYSGATPQANCARLSGTGHLNLTHAFRPARICSEPSATASATKTSCRTYPTWTSATESQFAS